MRLVDTSLQSSYGKARVKGAIDMRAITKAIVAGAFAALLATPALANITILAGPLPGLTPVALTSGPLDFFVNGTLLPGDPPVLFQSNENIIATNVGGTRVKPTDATFNFLTFALVGNFGFSAAQVNVDGYRGNGIANFQATDQFGNTFSALLPYAGRGNSFFNFVASGGQVIKSISITSTTPAHPFENIRDITIGGIVDLDVVPEPATWAMMILGFFGAGAMLRGGRRRAFAAI